MEMTLNNGFCEMTQDESMTTEGGIGFIAGCVIGAVGAWVVDGINCPLCQGHFELV